MHDDGLTKHVRPSPRSLHLHISTDFGGLFKSRAFLATFRRNTNKTHSYTPQQQRNCERLCGLLGPLLLMVLVQEITVEHVGPLKRIPFRMHATRLNSEESVMNESQRQRRKLPLSLFIQALSPAQTANIDYLVAIQNSTHNLRNLANPAKSSFSNPFVSSTGTSSQDALSHSIYQLVCHPIIQHSQ